MVSANLAFIDGLGTPEMLMIFVVILLLFGGQKLPEFARGLGKTLREFKKAASGVEEEFKRALEDDERKQNQLKLAETSATPSTTTENYAGPGTAADPYHDDPHHEQHYGDYSHEQDTPAADPAAPVPTGAPGPEIPAENQILKPEADAPDAPDAPAAAEPPHAAPDKKPESPGEAPKTP
ncbi:MAG: twin-arginine translocase TatA/TatE family subunit [Opitutaceae bacterium]|nr:twin-arginine translocase TatA/TatE family subunit [Opitutaceae bacterium]